LGAKEILKDNFNTLQEEEQIALMDMMLNIYQPSDVPFILENIHHKNFAVKSTLLQILKNLDLETYNGIASSSTDEEFIKIIKHLENY